MTEFDAEKFEDKYVHYFNELQRAYKNAFNRMNDEYDSELIHAIDQQVLNESEPFYEGDGEFRIELPENPTDRVQGILVNDEKLEETLSVYVDQLEFQLARVFGFNPSKN
jgi:transcription termination factor NusB